MPHFGEAVTTIPIVSPRTGARSACPTRTTSPQPNTRPPPLHNSPRPVPAQNMTQLGRRAWDSSSQAHARSSQSRATKVYNNFCPYHSNAYHPPGPCPKMTKHVKERQEAAELCTKKGEAKAFKRKTSQPRQPPPRSTLAGLSEPLQHMRPTSHAMATTHNGSGSGHDYQAQRRKCTKNGGCRLS